MTALAVLLILVQGSPTADAERAERALARGDRDSAAKVAGAVVQAYERAPDTWSAVDRTAAGRAYVVLGERDANALRRALATFDAAIAADSSLLEPRLRLGDLFLDKYNAPDARATYEGVLRLAPNNARALLGMARVLAFEGSPEALPMARRSAVADPRLAAAQVFLARSHLDAESYDSAVAVAGKALASDSSATSAWAVIGTVAWLRGDSAGFARARATVAHVQPRPADFYADIADAAARHRRYADAVRFGREAVALDSLSAGGLGVLGTNELRTGAIDSGRAHLERAFAIDPFHIWNKNTLDLLDELKTFRVTRLGRFQFVAPQAETAILTLYLPPLLDSAYAALASRYKYEPAPPIRLEVYRRHADFSVRTVGLAGLGALGVSFGTVLAMDAPSARERGSFNWGSTAWHELAHTFTLGRSDNRVPRWFSEGLSVLEERRARTGWGADVTLEFLTALADGKLRPVSTLNDGFVRPSFPGEVLLSYYQASLVCEMIEEGWGAAALPAMLAAYRDGRDTRGAMDQVLHVSEADFDQRFDGWLHLRFRNTLGWGKDPFVEAMTRAQALLARNRSDSARIMFVRAQALFPEYAGLDSPAWFLAQLDTAARRWASAVQQLTRITTRNETAWDANLLEADLRERLGDRAGAAAALGRLIWIWPYDETIHRRLAELAEGLDNQPVAVRERRAVVALDPADRLEARYQLARILARSGDRPAARREILAVLEQAPGFEKAQLLLLELQKEGGRP